MTVIKSKEDWQLFITGDDDMDFICSRNMVNVFIFYKLCVIMSRNIIWYVPTINVMETLLFDLPKYQAPLTFATTKIKQTDLYYLFYWLFVTAGQEFLLNGLYKQEINIIIDNRSRDFHFLTFKCYSLGRHVRPKRRSHWQE